MYMYKEDLALNSRQWLICHKTQSNQVQIIRIYTSRIKLPGSVDIL